MEKPVAQKHMSGIDAIRVWCAFIVFLFHVGNQWKINLWGCNKWINDQVEYCMIMFYLISGFCLRFSKKNEFSNPKDILFFYKSRIIRIFPLYYVIEIYRLIISVTYEGQKAIRFLMLPIRIFALQMEYPFEVYAGASWFIGSIMSCYIIYPLISFLFKNASRRVRMVYCAVVLGIVFYSVFLKQYIDGIDVYYRSFFRILEFSVGVVMPSRIFEGQKESVLPNSTNITLFFILAISVMYKLSKDTIEGMVLYGIQLMLLPIVLYFGSQIYVSQRISKVFKFLSGYTFEVFLLQDIILSTPFLDIGKHISGNYSKLFFCIIVIMILCGVWKVAVNIAVEILNKRRFRVE